jgi:tight adherence protein B
MPLLAATLVLAGAAVGRSVAIAARRAPARTRLPATVSRPRPCLAPPGWLAPRLAELDLTAPAATVWAGWLAAAIGLPLLAGVVGGAGLAALVFAGTVIGPAALWRVGRGRAAERYGAQLPFALDAVARSLRSGAGLHQAIAEAAAATAGALGADLARVAAEARAVGVIAALEGWERVRADAGVRLAVAALCLGVETGGAQARAVDGVAVTLRQRQATAAEARALASQARASALVIGVAPLGFCALTSATDARVAQFLFRSPAGLAVLAVGVVLDGLGAAWMARLTRLEP